MNIQDWFPLGWSGWTSLQSKGLSRVFFKPQFKSISSSALSFLYSPTLTSIHDYWKNHRLDLMLWLDGPLTRHYFVGKVMSLLFNMLSRLVITFLPTFLSIISLVATQTLPSKAEETKITFKWMSMVGFKKTLFIHNEIWTEIFWYLIFW